MLPFDITIRSATIKDLDAIIALFDAAREQMQKQGIDQWSDGYPEPEILEEDIARDEAYVLIAEKRRIVGYFFFFAQPEPAYATVENGAFREPGKAGVIHRVVISSDVRGRGLGRAIFDYAVKLAHIELCVSLRCDTHENNRPMRGLLAKCGFSPCGTVYYERAGKKTKRIAYDLLI